ncbi:uncharacterized protein CXorf38 homolog [Lampris incognitus]|uniref:uncharacterized protein CXorf38 homolog n=1 Tax=Lampris incognitus TaxID=2546036 RepID=UPI0024B61F9A|nr:uncharacterized protein CXorf38 homolog [Lampris incognitus]
MVHDELRVRLRDGGYVNWVKAGHCLRLLKDGLHPYTDVEMRSFHRDVVNHNRRLRQPCQRFCSSKGDRLTSLCPICSEWSRVILRHHRQPDATVNWGNCIPPSWSHNHWELAKAYMPRGLMKVKGFAQCDASALLNLMNYCDHFNATDPRLVREVIRCRNELMHSCDLHVDNEWMRRYQNSLKNLLQQLCHVSELATAAQEITEMLTADWSICISGLDRVDATPLDGFESDSVRDWEASANSISQWEVELLREKLDELLDDTETRDTEQLLRLSAFLQANRDLGELFSTELQAISSAETRL